MAEGCFAAGPGESGPSRCSRPRRGNSQRDHVSVPCGAGGRGGGGCRPLSPPVFTLLRQQTPLSCAAAGVDEGQVQDGLPVLSGEHQSPCLSLLLPPSCWTPAWAVCHSSGSGCWSPHAMEGGLCHLSLLERLPSQRRVLLLSGLVAELGPQRRVGPPLGMRVWSHTARWSQGGARGQDGGMRVLGSEPHAVAQRLSGCFFQEAPLAPGIRCSPVVFAFCWLLVGFLLGPHMSPGRARWAGPGFSGTCFSGEKADPCFAVLVEPASLLPRSPGRHPCKALRLSPVWPPCSRQPPSPLVSEEPQSCLGQVGPPAQESDVAVTPGSRWVPRGVCTWVPAAHGPPAPCLGRLPFASSVSAGSAWLCRLAF